MASGEPFDDTAKDRYLTLIERGRMPRCAAQDIGFAWSTIKKHLQSDQTFATRYEDAVGRRIERIEEVVFDQAEDGHFGSQRLILERLKADQWADKSKGLAGGSQGGTSVTQVAIVTTDALRELLSGENAAEALATVSALPVIETTGRDG